MAIRYLLTKEKSINRASIITLEEKSATEYKITYFKDWDITEEIILSSKKAYHFLSKRIRQGYQKERY